MGRNKMVFIGGPQQVGKATLALSLIGPRVRDFAARTCARDDGVPGAAPRCPSSKQRAAKVRRRAGL